MQNEVLPSPKRSIIWKYFEKVSEKEAKCCECSARFKTPTGTTSTLAKHLVQHSKSYSEYLILKKTQENKKKVIPLQTNLADAFAKQARYSSDHPRARSITNKIAKMIVLDLQPYSVVNDRGFRELVKELEPRYVVPNRSTFSRSVIPNMFNSLKEKIKAEMASHFKDASTSNSIAFTTDIWTSRNNDSYISLTCHYLRTDFKPVRYSLNNRPFPGEHTGAAIANVIIQMSGEWGIPTTRESTVVYIVTDNARNMKVATARTSWNDISCFAHTLQLAIVDGKKECTGLNAICLKSRAIVGHYRRSPQAQERLNKFQVQMNKPQHDLIQDVVTRWNSEYQMLSRLVEQKEVISAELAASGVMDNLTVAEWKLAAGYVAVLSPINEATNDMSGESYPTLSMVIPIIHGMEMYLNSYTSQPNVSGIMFARSLLKALKARFPDYRTRKENLMSTMIDPRFKTAIFEEHEKALAIGFLKTLIIELKECDPIPAGEIANAVPMISAQTTVPSSSVWDYFDTATAASRNENVPSNVDDHISMEISQFLKEPVIERHANSYCWWEKNYMRFKYLSVPARCLLNIPATSVPSERLFSTSGNIVTAKREALKTKHVEQLTFLHDNLE